MFENIDPNTISDAMIGGGAVAAFMALGFLALVLVAALYIYVALAWAKIAQKLKYKNAWLAWVPIANVAMVLQLGGFHWAWIFLICVPVLGWIALFIMSIIATWRIFEKTKHPGWWSLSSIIPKVGGLLYLLAIGVVAWSGKKVSSSKKKSSRRKR